MSKRILTHLFLPLILSVCLSGAVLAQTATKTINGVVITVDKSPVPSGSANVTPYFSSGSVSMSSPNAFGSSPYSVANSDAFYAVNAGASYYINLSGNVLRFLWGSVNSNNTIELYNISGTPSSLPGVSNLVTTLTGQTLFDNFTSANSTAPITISTNAVVELQLTGGSFYNSLKFSAQPDGVFEFANLQANITAVPLDASGAGLPMLLGAGALAWLRRRKGSSGIAKFAVRAAQ